MFKKSLLPCLSMLAGIMIGAPSMAAVTAQEAAKLGAELTPLGAETRPLGEWLTMFHLATVALDQYTNESSWILPTAVRVLEGLRGADARVNFLVTADERALARIAWHLGNRHLPTQIMAKGLRIRRDHVIEAMVRGLGARVIEIEAPFDPEGGAYAHHSHDEEA